MAFAPFPFPAAPAPRSLDVIVGCGAPDGLWHVPFDPNTGAWGPPRVAASLPDATYAVHAGDGSRLYAVSEAPGEVAAFDINPNDGRLTELNRQSSLGAHPCHLAAAPDGRTLVVANYTGGSITAYPVEPDGRLGAARDQHAASGSGPRSDRQEGPHAHAVVVSPNGRHLLVCDLGLDEVRVHQFDRRPGTVPLAGVPAGRVPPGAGPRHAVFSADGRRVYVLNELDGTLTTLAYDSDTGGIVALDTISALPPGGHPAPLSAAIRRHPTRDDLLYVSHRGPELLAVLDLPSGGGRPRLRNVVPTGGSHPRDFALSPDGRWLVCANRFSDELRTFAVHPETGDLAATPHIVRLPAPCCVLFPGRPGR